MKLPNFTVPLNENLLRIKGKNPQTKKEKNNFQLQRIINQNGEIEE